MRDLFPRICKNAHGPIGELILMGMMLFIRTVLVHVNKFVGVKEDKAKVSQSTGIRIYIGCFFIG